MSSRRASFSETRSKSGVLTPDSGSSPNSRKRKRESSSNTIDDLLKDSFIVRPYRSLVIAKPRALQPMLVLPRSDLQLSYLDNGVSSSALSQSRFFESHIKILELEARLGSRPMVLIARLDDEKSIYAVEREDRGLYVLCKLGSWVDLATLKDNAVVSRPDHVLQASAVAGGTRTGFAEPGIESLITPESSKFNKKQRLAIEAMQTKIKKPRPQTPFVETPRCEDLPLTNIATAASIVQDSTNGLEELRKDDPLPTSEIVEPTAAELLDTVRTQYFEALYLSQASLAYFTKGPLARARTAFYLAIDSTLDMQDLIEFLETLVLTTSTIDKKFKTSVPELVQKMAVEFLSGDDASKPSKKRKTKKMKRGKNGLYPGEDELIRKWINNNKRDDDSGILNDSAIKSRIAELRTRETKLQMIVLLEVLALKSQSHTVDGDDGLPSAPPNESADAKKEKSRKGKKPEELEALIDVHIDRLCIYQEVAGENGTGLDNSSLESGLSSGVLAGIGKHETNSLHDFCVDVITPFFSSRLPELCATINSKLGGPIAKPPPRQKMAKSASTSGTMSRPGAAARRPVLDKSRQSLQRVLTNERRARSVSRGTPDSAAISLMRSVSMSTANVPRLKRETSEALSLASIPSIESQPSRSHVLDRKRFSQREVDLSVPPSAAADLKSKKQAAVQAQIREAIAVVKKPNRQLAGKALVETAEQRTASASKSSRKTTKPIRNPLFQDVKGVQIMATPKTGRHKDMMPAPRTISNVHATPKKSSQEMIPASSAGQVPDSTIRPRSSTTFTKASSATHAHPPREKNPFNIAETPSRPPSRSHTWMNDSHTADFPPSSPTFVRNSKSQNDEDFQFVVPNSVVRDSVVRNPFASIGDGNGRSVAAVEATPTKPRGSRGRSLASFAPPGLPSFSQTRRNSLVSAPVSDINAGKSAAVRNDAMDKGKENITPRKSTSGGRGIDGGDSIYKMWEEDDLDELAS